MSSKSANSTRRGASFVHQWQVRLSAGLFVLGLLTAITGCPRTKTTKPETVENAPPKVEVLPDDDAVVQKFIEAGFQVDKNSDGLVVLVSAAANADNPDLVALLSDLDKLPNIQNLKLTGSGVDDGAIAALPSLKRLDRLDLSGSAISDEGMKVVGQVASLRVFFARLTGITDAGIAELSGLKNLRAVDLRNGNAKDEGMKHLAKVSSLVDIQLERTNVTAAGLKELTTLPLKSINLNLNAIYNEGLLTLSEITSLESIQIDSGKVTDEGMAGLANLKNLSRLRMRDNDVTGSGFQNIAGLDKLERLELRGTSLDDAALDTITALPNVKRLDISECRLASGEGLAKIANLTKLTHLGLWETKLTDEALIAIADAAKDLEDLNIEACTNITSAVGDALGGLTKLKRINISGTQIDDDGLEKIAALPNLEFIRVVNTAATSRMIDKLYDKEGLEVEDF